MIRCPRIALAATVVLALVALSAARAAEPPAAQLVPEDAALVLHVTDPKALWDLALSPGVVETVASSPPYRSWTDSGESKQLLSLVEYIEAKFETDWKTILRKLTGGGITWAVGPDQNHLLIVDAEDPRMLKELNDFLVFIIKSDAQNKGEPQRVGSAEYRGVTGWTFGPGEAHAIAGGRLILSNKPAALRAALDRRADPAGASLARSTRYQQAEKGAGPSAAWLYADMEALESRPGVEQALLGNDNPLAVLLLAGLRESLGASSWLSLGLRVEGDALRVQLVGDGPAASTGAAPFATPNPPEAGALPNLVVPRQIAAVSLYRDFHGFYAAKDDLFPERTSGLIFFENMMGIFFTGRDLTEEVLAETLPETRLVVARQAYAAEVGTPAVQIPAFAAVLRLKRPKEFSRVVEEAWQKAIGLVNFTRGQQALPGLMIERPVHADVKYTLACFAAPEGEDRSAVDVRFNFQPSLAMFGEWLVLGSSDGLTKDLIDALKAEQAAGAKPIAGAQSMVRIDGRELGAILEANREAMVRQNMLEKGHSLEQAETEIGLLLALLERIESLKLDVGGRDGQLRAAAELKLHLPAASGNEAATREP